MLKTTPPFNIERLQFRAARRRHRWCQVGRRIFRNYGDILILALGLVGLCTLIALR